MGWEAWFMLGLMALILAGLVSNRAPDAVLVAAMVLCAAFGIVSPAEALSGFANTGLITVAALFVVTYTFAFSIPARSMVRALLLASSPLLAVVVNILRLMPTVMFYGYASENTATTFHDLSGWFMMVIALVVLWAIMRLLRWMELPVLNYGAMRE